MLNRDLFKYITWIWFWKNNPGKIRHCAQWDPQAGNQHPNNCVLCWNKSILTAWKSKHCCLKVSSTGGPWLLHSVCSKQALSSFPLLPPCFPNKKNSQGQPCHSNFGGHHTVTLASAECWLLPVQSWTASVCILTGAKVLHWDRKLSVGQGCYRTHSEIKYCRFSAKLLL